MQLFVNIYNDKNRFPDIKDALPPIPASLKG